MLLGFVALQVAAKNELVVVWRPFHAPNGVQVDERGNLLHPQWPAGHCQWQVGDTAEVQSLACMKRHVFMGNTGGSVGGIPQLLTEALVMY